jgi:hypothetical protein
MKKSISLFFILYLTTICSRTYAQNGTIFVNVYVIGLEQTIERIVISELSTQEQLDAVTRAIENEFINSKKFGNTPFYAAIDNMIEDLSSQEIQDDAEVVFLLYTDGVNTSLEKGLFRDPVSQQYTNNKVSLERYIISKLHSSQNGRHLLVIPVLTIGQQNESNIAFLQSICFPPGERVYLFKETDLIRKKLFHSHKSSSLFLNILLDHSSSMESIHQAVGHDVIQKIKDIYIRIHEPEKEGNDLSISLDDFMNITGGPAFVGTQPPFRPDEIYFTFELSPFRIMKTPVLQKHYQKYLTERGSENPSKILGEDCPQTNLTYNEILDFVKWLNSKWDGPGVFRLQTEYEWEYVARLKPAGFSRGDPITREITSTMYDDYDVTEKKDPKGNPNGTHLVVRGVSYEDSSDPMMGRPEYRGRIAKNDSSPLVGFRLILCE